MYIIAEIITAIALVVTFVNFVLMRKAIFNIRMLLNASNTKANENFKKLNDSINLIIQASNILVKNVETLHERMDDKDEMDEMAGCDFEDSMLKIEKKSKTENSTVKDAKNKSINKKKLH